ncbi:hypothetical protein LAWI1_G001484 [Lachnellula willkommii]|uniref:HTH CENPB-type domain-containing protein n=1 Tax=Lachnellula willkommii TaxID=215461 RepID=A0A559MKK4_9HELO|nr:hypothetical protein LAWI1_G001484 [Lachnellula willkommii]
MAPMNELRFEGTKGNSISVTLREYLRPTANTPYSYSSRFPALFEQASAGRLAHSKGPETDVGLLHGASRRQALSGGAGSSASTSRSRFHEGRARIQGDPELSQSGGRLRGLSGSGAAAQATPVPAASIRRPSQSEEEKAQGQQYLTPQEEKALVDFLLRMSDLGCLVRVKFLPSLAFSIARRRTTTDRAIKPPNKNWSQAFERRHPDLKARRVRAMDWSRYDKNIYNKITHWFEVIEKELRRPDIDPRNVYNMDETGVMLSMLDGAKVLVGKDDRRDYRGARVKREMVTAIECVSAAGESLKPMVIWPAKTYRSNWTMLDTPRWHYACSTKGYNDAKISLDPARARAITKKNVLPGWAKAGLYPLNLDRVLKDIAKLVAALTIPKSDEALRIPLTPVSGEALASLLNMIKQVPDDETNKPHKEKLQEKVNNAAVRAFAKDSLQQDYIQFLLKMNDKSKPRRSTKSVVLGKAKIMSYEDLKEAQEKRAARER